MFYQSALRGKLVIDPVQEATASLPKENPDATVEWSFPSQNNSDQVTGPLSRVCIHTIRQGINGPLQITLLRAKSNTDPNLLLGGPISVFLPSTLLSVIQVFAFGIGVLIPLEVALNFFGLGDVTQAGARGAGFG